MAGCARAPSPVPSPTTVRAPERPVEARTEGVVFDPSQHRAEDVREEAERIIRQIPPPAAEPERLARDTLAAGDTTWITVEGYRIQIFAATTREAAKRAAELARQRFPNDSVYVVFQAPWHKVRVGDFRTREEAEAKLLEARRKGYREAFWVPSRVRVIRRPGDPLPER